MSGDTIVAQLGEFLCQNNGDVLAELDPQRLYVHTSFVPDVDQLRLSVLDGEGVEVATYTAILQEEL